MSTEHIGTSLDPVHWRIKCFDCENKNRLIVEYIVEACDILAAELAAYRLLDADSHALGIKPCNVDIHATYLPVAVDPAIAIAAARTRKKSLMEIKAARRRQVQLEVECLENELEIHL